MAGLFLCLATQALGQRGPIPGLNATTPYLIYYGNWDSTKVAFARDNYRMVILHPSSNITAAQIAMIQSGRDNIRGTADDVLVFAYLSVGEDDRPGAPFVGDGLGPRVDPRPSDDTPLSSITNALGLPSPGGIGYASYYLDTKSSPDGLPDRNSVFGGCYVNAGAPAWWDVIKNMTKARDGRSGLDEILTSNIGNGYHCDGVFLDTIDTAAPNYGTTTYEWTAPGMQALVQRISTNYPTRLIMANRGLFFYSPNLKQYAYTLRPYVNAVMFESYFTDCNNADQVSPYFPDNKFNLAPKLNAEAGRPDGFSIIALGYDHTPPLPQAIIDQDYYECMDVQGWPLYRTSPQLDTAFNTLAASWVAAHPDTEPPVWDSTAASSGVQPPPRVGAQEVVASDQSVTVRWDVARDQTGPVHYNVYYTAEPALDFATAARLVHVTPSIPANYRAGAGPGSCPYEYTVTGLTNGVKYRFAVRAEDSLAPAHEDTNTVTLSATAGALPGRGTYRHITVDGNTGDWAGVPLLAAAPLSGSSISFAEVYAANDSNYLYLRFTLHSPAAPFSDYNIHIFVDADNQPATGYHPTGASVGSELMVESGAGYDERSGSFAPGKVNGLGWSLAPAGWGTNFEVRLSRLARYADNSLVFTNPAIRLLLQDNRGSMLLPQGVPYTFAPDDPYEDWRAAHFTPGELANPSLSGDGADASGDGIPNLVKYASNLDPHVVNHPALPRATVRLSGQESYLETQYTQRNPPAGVSYLPQVSTNLIEWDSAPENFVLIDLSDQGDGTSLATLRLQVPNTTPPQRYVRIAIQALSQTRPGVAW